MSSINPNPSPNLNPDPNAIDPESDELPPINDEDHLRRRLQEGEFGGRRIIRQNPAEGNPVPRPTNPELP